MTLSRIVEKRWVDGCFFCFFFNFLKINIRILVLKNLAISHFIKISKCKISNIFNQIFLVLFVAHVNNHWIDMYVFALFEDKHPYSCTQKPCMSHCIKISKCKKSNIFNKKRKNYSNRYFYMERRLLINAANENKKYIYITRDKND